MADELEIRSGGVVAVDTGALNDLAERLSAIALRVEDAASQVRRAECLLLGALPNQAMSAVAVPSGSADALEIVASACVEDAAATRLMADTFALVDLQARMEAVAVSDPQSAARLQTRIDALLESDPRLAREATILIQEWKRDRFRGLASQDWDLIAAPLTGGSVSLGLAMRRIAAGLAANGAGIIPQGATLRGPTPPVTVQEVARTAPANAPQSTEDLLRRIPGESDAQVRVETYTYPDGSREHIVYLDGTQAMLPGDDPWDMGSNWDGYNGADFASLEAARQALSLAGVKEGEAVTAVGYSQGAMIASYLAMDDSMNVKSVVLVGSPTMPMLRDDQTLVQFSHTADPVASLAGGGSPGTNGAPGSFVVTREGTSGSGGFTSPGAAHQRQEYLETAARADASNDRRVAAYRDSIRRLGDATTVTAIDYRASRP